MYKNFVVGYFDTNYSPDTEGVRGLTAQIRKLWTIFWCQALKAQNSQLSVAVSFAQIGPLGAEKSHFSYFRIFKIIQICDWTTLPKFSRKFLIKKTCNALWEGSDQLKSGSSDAHAHFAAAMHCGK